MKNLVLITLMTFSAQSFAIEALTCDVSLNADSDAVRYAGILAYELGKKGYNVVDEATATVTLNYTNSYGASDEVVTISVAGLETIHGATIPRRAGAIGIRELRTVRKAARRLEACAVSNGAVNARGEAMRDAFINGQSSL